MLPIAHVTVHTSAARIVVDLQHATSVRTRNHAAVGM